MEWISDLSVYRQADAKDEWALSADYVHLQGLGGSDSEMYAQLLYLIEKTQIPVDKDAARIAFDCRDDARSKVRGLKNSGDHFASQNQASFV